MAAALGMAAGAALFQNHGLFRIAFTLAALGVAIYGAEWVVTGRAVTKYLPPQRGVRARLMGLGLMVFAALLVATALRSLAAM